MTWYTLIDPSDQIREVLKYFVPDTFFLILNLYFTFMIVKDTKEKTQTFLKYTMWGINLCFIINILSAIFYIWLYLEH